LFVTVTEAFGTTAPDSSRTVPEIVPVGFWANTALAKVKNRRHTNRRGGVFLVMNTLSLKRA
jgi:hypothetical protein